MKRFSLLLLFILALVQPVCAKTIHIILPEQNEAFITAGKIIREQISAKNTSVNIQLVKAGTVKSINIDAKDLLIPVGNQAAESIEQITSNPVLYSFVKASSLPKASHKWAAVVLDQPVERLIKSVSSILNKNFKQRILVAHTENNRLIADQLQQTQLAGENELDIVTLANNAKPAKQIEDKLFNAGALIAVNDAHIWQGKNAKWMLYQAYRYNVPVVGYSKKFLKAGALVSVYSSLEQIAAATADLSLKWIQGKGEFNKNINHANYNIEYNQNIARALNISTPADQLNIESEQ